MADEYSEITDKLEALDPAFKGVVTTKNPSPHRNVRLSDASNFNLYTAYREHGSHVAREKMIEGNQGLVMAQALNYRHQPVPLGRIIRQAGVGLALAIDTFDPSKGTKFSAHAKTLIRSAVEKYIRKQRELPSSSGTPIRHSRPFNDPRHKVTPDRAQAASREVQPLSISSLLNSESDLVGDEQEPTQSITDHVLCRELVENLDHAVKSLSPGMREIMIRYFGLNKIKPEPLSSIAESLGISDSQVKHRIQAALSSLRSQITGN